jgi:mRNA interferase RelE/StbE
MSYKIVISKLAQKEIKDLPKTELSKVVNKIYQLADNPRPEGCKKLQGSSEDLWRIRSGDYRIIYCLDDTIRIVDVRRVAHRKEVYK